MDSNNTIVVNKFNVATSDDDAMKKIIIKLLIIFTLSLLFYILISKTNTQFYINILMTIGFGSLIKDTLWMYDLKE